MASLDAWQLSGIRLVRLIAKVATRPKPMFSSSSRAPVTETVVSTFFLVLFFVSMLGISVLRARALNNIVSDFDPYRVRVIPTLGKRSDFNEQGWRDRNRSIACQFLGIVCALLWILFKDA